MEWDIVTVEKNILNDIIEKHIEKELNRDDYSGTNLISDLGLDSVSIVQVMVEVEEAFHIEINLEEDGIEIIAEYDRLLEYILKKANQG